MKGTVVFVIGGGREEEAEEEGRDIVGDVVDEMFGAMVEIKCGWEGRVDVDNVLPPEVGLVIPFARVDIPAQSSATVTSRVNILSHVKSYSDAPAG